MQHLPHNGQSGNCKHQCGFIVIDHVLCEIAQRQGPETLAQRKTQKKYHIISIYYLDSDKFQMKSAVLYRL